MLLLFSFSFDPIINTDVRSLGGRTLWIVYLFAGILILNRSFARETAGAVWDALVASPIPASAIFVGKLVANACCYS